MAAEGGHLDVLEWAKAQMDKEAITDQPRR
jgi:hypothetical protein